MMLRPGSSGSRASTGGSARSARSAAAPASASTGGGAPRNIGTGHHTVCGCLEMLPPLSKLTLDTEETSGEKGDKRTINDVGARENSDVPAPQRRLNSVHDEHQYRVGIIPYGQNEPLTIDNEPGEPHGLLTRKDIATIVRDKEKMKRFCNSEFMVKKLPEKMRLRNSKGREDKTSSTLVFAMEDKDLIGLVVIGNYLRMTFYSENDTSIFSSPLVYDNGRLNYSERKNYSYAWLKNNVDNDATSSNLLDILAKHKVALPTMPYIEYGCTVRSVEGDLCRTGVMRYLLAGYGYWHNKVIVKNKVEAMTRAAAYDFEAAKRKFDIAKASYLALEWGRDDIVDDREAMESAKKAYDNLVTIAGVGYFEGELSPAFMQVKAAKQTYDVANETYTRKQSVLQSVKSVYERATVDFDSASATLDSLKDREALERALRRLSFFKLYPLDDNALAAWRGLGFEYRKVFEGQYTAYYLVRNTYQEHVEKGVARPVASNFISRCREAAATR